MIVVVTEMIVTIVVMTIEEIDPENIVEIAQEIEIIVQEIEIIEEMIVAEKTAILVMKEMIVIETLGTVTIESVVDSVVQFRKKNEFLLSKHIIRYFLQSYISN